MPTPAQWQSGLVLDQILTTTLFNYLRTLYEQILTRNFYYYWLYSRDRIMTQDGGPNIVVPLMYGLNSTVGSYDSYDDLDVTPQDGLTPALFEWRQVGGTLSISRKEERMNSGRSRILSLLQTKIDQLRMSFDEKLAEMAFLDGSGNGGKDLLGLRALVENNATFGTLGGINANTHTWWRNQKLDMTAFFAAGNFDGAGAGGDLIAGFSAVRKLYLACSNNPGGQPDFGLTHVDTYAEFEAALSDDVRYTDLDTAQHGFMNLKHKNATVSWEQTYILGGTPAAPTFGTVGNWYFLNSQFLKIIVDSETNFKAEPFVTPANQDARTSKLLLMGNNVVTNRRVHGVLHSIT
jgi:hypothetical protein